MTITNIAAIAGAAVVGLIVGLGVSIQPPANVTNIQAPTATQTPQSSCEGEGIDVELLRSSWRTNGYSYREQECLFELSQKRRETEEPVNPDNSLSPFWQNLTCEVHEPGKSCRTVKWTSGQCVGGRSDGALVVIGSKCPADREANGGEK